MDLLFYSLLAIATLIYLVITMLIFRRGFQVRRFVPRVFRGAIMLIIITLTLVLISIYLLLRAFVDFNI